MSTAGPSQPASEHRAVHVTLIEMLFALALAEVALEFATVVEYCRNAAAPQAEWRMLAVPIAQLLLSIMVISLSWIGWNAWIAAENAKSPTPIRPSFMELLVDAFLVISYFVLVKTTEVPKSDAANAWTHQTPNAVPEAVCLFAVFSLYFIWDLVARRPRKWAQLTQLLPSLLSAALLFCSSSLLPMSSTKPLVVVAIDVYLIAIAFLFRAGQAFELNPRARREWILVVICLAVAAAACGAAWSLK